MRLIGSLVLDRIAEAIHDAYGIELRGVRKLDVGNDPFVQAFHGAGISGDGYFIKLRVGLSSGVILSSVLAEAGIEVVLAPLKTLRGHNAAELSGSLLLVYPFIDGCNGFERELPPEIWKGVGTALRRIHDFQLPIPLTSRFAREQFGVQGVEGFARRLTEIESDHSAAPLTESLARHRELIGLTVLRVAELGAKCRASDWQLVPCHADIHVGNILWNEKGFRIVDWDMPRLAPRECDLMFFCGGGIAGHGEEEESSFFQGYGSFSPDLLLLTYYRFARALEDMVAFAREAEDPNSDHLARASALRWFEGLFAPKMIVDTAILSHARKSD